MVIIDKMLFGSYGYLDISDRAGLLLIRHI